MLSQEMNELLTRVGPGTPCGELLRRYWHPIVAARELTEIKPKKRVRVGWLAELGIMDFAGGIVVHTTAGVSALVLAKFLGGRRGFPNELRPLDESVKQGAHGDPNIFFLMGA